MKKTASIFLSIILFCSSNALAKDIVVRVNNITSQTGYYCLEIFLGPFQHVKGCGFSTQRGTDFINNYLIGITDNPNDYIKFASSTRPNDNPHWPLNPKYRCAFSFTQSANLSVMITPTSCQISLG